MYLICSLIFFSLVHIHSTNMEEVGDMTVMTMESKVESSSSCSDCSVCSVNYLD